MMTTATAIEDKAATILRKGQPRGDALEPRTVAQINATAAALAVWEEKRGRRDLSERERLDEEIRDLFFLLTDPAQDYTRPHRHRLVAIVHRHCLKAACEGWPAAGEAIRNRLEEVLERAREAFIDDAPERPKSETATEYESLAELRRQGLNPRQILRCWRVPDAREMSPAECEEYIGLVEAGELPQPMRNVATSRGETRAPHCGVLAYVHDMLLSEAN